MFCHVHLYFEILFSSGFTCKRSSDFANVTPRLICKQYYIDHLLKVETQEQEILVALFSTVFGDFNVVTFKNSSECSVIRLFSHDAAPLAFRVSPILIG